MNKKEHFWTILQEECAEIIHIVSKIKRFGISDYNQNTGELNIVTLQKEINDLYSTFELLTESDIPHELFTPDRELIESKKAKVRKYLTVSRDRGTLS